MKALITRILAVTFTTLIVYSNASASLIGDTINARWQFGNIFDDNQNFLVGLGSEGQWLNMVNIDISGSAINIDYPSGIAQQIGGTIWTFSSLEWVGPEGPGKITSVTPSTNWVNWNNNFVSFGDDYIRIDFLNTVLFGEAGNFLSLRIEAAHVGLPEPSTLGLISIGLAGIAWARRRKIT